MLSINPVSKKSYVISFTDLQVAVLDEFYAVEHQKIEACISATLQYHLSALNDELARECSLRRQSSLFESPELDNNGDSDN